MTLMWHLLVRMGSVVGLRAVGRSALGESP